MNTGRSNEETIGGAKINPEPMDPAKARIILKNPCEYMIARNNGKLYLFYKNEDGKLLYNTIGMMNGEYVAKHFQSGQIVSVATIIADLNALQASLANRTVQQNENTTVLANGLKKRGADLAVARFNIDDLARFRKELAEIKDIWKNGADSKSIEERLQKYDAAFNIAIKDRDEARRNLNQSPTLEAFKAEQEKNKPPKEEISRNPATAKPTSEATPSKYKFPVHTKDEAEMALKNAAPGTWLTRTNQLGVKQFSYKGIDSVIYHAPVDKEGNIELTNGKKISLDDFITQMIAAKKRATVQPVPPPPTPTSSPSSSKASSPATSQASTPRSSRSDSSANDAAEKVARFLTYNIQTIFENMKRADIIRCNVKDGKFQIVLERGIGSVDGNGNEKILGNISPEAMQQIAAIINQAPDKNQSAQKIADIFRENGVADARQTIQVFHWNEPATKQAQVNTQPITPTTQRRSVVYGKTLPTNEDIMLSTVKRLISQHAGPRYGFSDVPYVDIRISPTKKDHFVITINEPLSGDPRAARAIGPVNNPTRQVELTAQEMKILAHSSESPNVKEVVQQVLSQAEKRQAAERKPIGPELPRPNR